MYYYCWIILYYYYQVVINVINKERKKMESKHKQIKEIMKISISEISEESGLSTTMTHGYLQRYQSLSAERVLKTEIAIEAIARKRINKVNYLLGGVNG